MNLSKDNADDLLPPLMNQKNPTKQILITPNEIQKRITDKNLEFESDAQRDKFENELFNHETVSKFIESSFNGNVLHLGPLDEEKAEKRWKTI